MFQGNWKCSICGGPITELPFQPRSESGLTCRSCYGKQKEKESGHAGAPEFASATEAPDIPFEAGVAGEPAPVDDMAGAAPTTPGERATFSGDWKCAECGNPITSLPFEPRSSNNLKCIDCFKKGKA